MRPKYDTIEEFLAAMRRGAHKHQRVTAYVDNDAVSIYAWPEPPSEDPEDDEPEQLFDFDNRGPQRAMVMLLNALDLGIVAAVP